MPETEALSVESGPGSRSASRLAAVQALYQAASTDASVRQIVSEFQTWRIGKEVDGDQYRPADMALFEDIFKGATERLTEVDSQIGAATQGRTIARIERLVLAILRAGTYELIARPDIPTPVIINEYLDIANAFFTESEPGFVNGVLDRIARTVRPGNSG